MSLLKNLSQLATSPQRTLALQMVDAALQAIQFKQAVQANVKLEGTTLQIADARYDLDKYNRVMVIGFGKGSGEVSLLLEEQLGEHLTAGWDIDVVESPNFNKINYTKGTHPLPSQTNLDFTKQVLDHTTTLTEEDLVLVVICGGGSALFEYPAHLSLDQITKVNEALVKSGATIGDMNIVRKHLSAVKGGKLAQHLSPAHIACLIFSDVPGNNLETIASGPTVEDPSTMDDVERVLKEYQLDTELNLSTEDFAEGPHQAGYFQNVNNLLMLSNKTALEAMKQVAAQAGHEAVIINDQIQGDARVLGQDMLDQVPSGQIGLFGGESTIKVTNREGKGGRNQALVLGALPHLNPGDLIVSFGSDGSDFYGFGGAIGDESSLEKAEQQGLDPIEYLQKDNSYVFWEAVGDGIDTGKLGSNVSDLMLVIKG